MKKIYGKVIGILVCMLLSIFYTPIKAQAYSRVDTEQMCSIEISADTEGVAFRIYQVAEMSEIAEFTVTDTFSGYSVELEQEDQEGWRAQALALAGYVQRDQIAALAEGVTDEAGMLRITDLTPGLYLVLGTSYETENVRYTFTPFLVSLPNLTESDEWEYHPVIRPKYEQQTKPDSTTIQAVKTWKDNGNEKKRPAEIVVQLLKDGQVYEEKALNAGNNWRYVWKDLSADAEWSITEKKVPAAYTVKVEKEGNTYIVTNTYNTPDKPRTPGGKLPQTGQLWWPVPWLALGGIIMILLGCMMRRRESEQDENR